MESITLNIGGKLKHIGDIYPEKNLFVKHVLSSRHLFQSSDSWGIDDSLLRERLLPRNSYIQYHDDETKTIYQTTADEFEKSGEYLNFKGYGLQRFLKRSLWKTKTI